MKPSKMRSIIAGSIAKTELRLLDLMRQYDPIASLDLDDPYRVCPDSEWDLINALNEEIQELNTAYGETYNG